MHTDIVRELEARLVDLGAVWMPTPNVGGRFLASDPIGIVIHYTGGPHGTAAKWLCNPKAKASATLVIQRDGGLYWLVNLDRIAWHAGRSELHGRYGCNDFTWGIELENWGPIVRRGDGYYVWPPVKDGVPQFQRRFSGGEVRHYPEHREYEFWEGYTEAQIGKLNQVLQALLWPSLINGPLFPRESIVGHEHVSPGRKLDPGPAFPWRDVLREAYHGSIAVADLDKALDDESDEAFFAAMGAKPIDRR